MRKFRNALCCFLALLLSAAGLQTLAGCGRHRHNGALTALKTEGGGEIPRCGVFLCADCGETYEASVTYKNTGLPVVSIDGDLSGISKTEKVTVTLTYDGAVSFHSLATLKWQGGSTLQFPKKNYSVKLIGADGKKNPVALNEAWGEQSKYCLKANWSDFAGARNVVSAKLWGDIVHAHNNGDRLQPLVNGGGVDGFPVLTYINGDFWGLYSFNTPKDAWIFGMEDAHAREGLLFGEEWSSSTSLREPIADINDPAASGWDVEYCSTENTAKTGVGWLAAGMNDLIAFLQANEGEALLQGLDAYTDVDRAIDYMLFTLFILGADNTGRNVLWATYDGKKYVPCAYDLDNTWMGLTEGLPAELREAWTNGDALRENLLFDRLLDACPARIAARYAALREGPLSEENVAGRFTAYLSPVSEIIRTAEAARWKSEPDLAVNEIDRLTAVFRSRAAALDAHFGYAPAD